MNTASGPPIFLLSGTPGSGKSTVSNALLQHFPLGLHIPMDDVREWVVSGRASIFNWNDETTHQFELSRKSATDAVKRYAKAGFAIAIDDVLFPQDAEKFFLEPLAVFTVHKVLLKPTLETVLARNASRTNKAFDTTVLIATIRELHKQMDEQSFKEQGWLVLDSSELTLEQTVAVILGCGKR